MSATRNMIALAILAFTAPLFAQVPTDPPAPAAPAQLTPAEKNRVEATKLHALGAMRKNQGLYLEAIAAWEAGLKLDADAVPPRKMLAAAYRVVGRLDDALAECKKVTELSPTDFDGWQRYADQLKELGRNKEAAAALDIATKCASAAERPEEQFLALHKLATWYEKQPDTLGVINATKLYAAVLEKNKSAFRSSGFLTNEEYDYEKAGAFERLGRAYLRSDAPDLALAAFVDAQRIFLGRDDPAAKARVYRLHLHLAEVHSAKGEIAEAFEHLLPYLRAKPQSVEPFKLFASLMDRRGQKREKLAALDAYAREDKANLPLQLFTAEQYTDADQFDESQAIYLAAAKDHPKPEVYKGLLKLYLRYQRMELIIERLDRYLETIEDKGRPEADREEAGKQTRAIYAALRSEPALLRAAVPKAQDEWINQINVKNNLNNYKTFSILATLCSAAGDLAKSEKLLRDAIGRVPWPSFQVVIDEPLIQILKAERKWDEIVSLCDSELGKRRRNDNKFMYHYYKILPLTRLGKIDDAIAAADQAIEVAHSEGAKFGARAQKIAVYSWSGDHTKAVKEAEKLSLEFPGPEFARRIKVTQAQAYFEAKNYAKSEKIYRILLDADPNDASTCNSLGYLLADQNRNLDEAERLIRRAIDLDRVEQKHDVTDDDDEEETAEQENAAYLDSLGWVLFRQGKYTEARIWIEKSLTLPSGKEDPTMWDHLGDVCFRAGDKAKAMIAWNRAAEFYAQDRRGKKDGRAEEVDRKLRLAE